MCVIQLSSVQPDHPSQLVWQSNRRETKALRNISAEYRAWKGSDACPAWLVQLMSAFFVIR
jgi:hypothetical protein